MFHIHYLTQNVSSTGRCWDSANRPQDKSCRSRQAASSRFLSTLNNHAIYGVAWDQSCDPATGSPTPCAPLEHSGVLMAGPLLAQCLHSLDPLHSHLLHHLPPPPPPLLLLLLLNPFTIVFIFLPLSVFPPFYLLPFYLLLKLLL